MIELLLVVVIVQLGFVLSRLPKNNSTTKQSFSERFPKLAPRRRKVAASFSTPTTSGCSSSVQPPSAPKALRSACSA